MIIFIAFASLIDYILNNIEKYTKSENLQKFIFIIFIIMFISLQYLKNIKLIQETHCLTTKNNQYSNMLMHNKEIFKSLRLPQNTILFNVKGRHYIEAMFYTNFPAYNFIPNIEQYKYLKNKNKQIAIFCNDTNLLPDYLSNDPNIIVIKKELQGYD